MVIKDFFCLLNEYFTLLFVFPSIIVLGIYLSVKLRFIQVFKLKISALSLLKSDEKEQGNISHYQAISAVIAGNLGTGNISGMAIALAAGGPGSLVWMWVMAFFGAAIQYVSCVLGVKYRQKTAEGEFVGGPMYYLRDGLGYKKLAAIFCVFSLIASLTVGNFAQINSIALPLQSLGLDPLYCGLAMMVIVGFVILGGIQRIAHVASSIVPVMAALYLGAGLVILGCHFDKIGGALWLMFSSAFTATSFIGGSLGYGVVKAITTGFERGIFATDAGTGIVPILQSSARTTNPIVDGMVTLVAPFIVMIVCTTTGLILLVTGAFHQPDLQSTNMVTYAFTQVFGSHIGSFIVVSSLTMFAFTTVVAWGCCADKAASYLWGKKSAKAFQYFYLVLIPFGAIAQVDLVWMLADISIALMLVTNFIGVAGLSKEVVADSNAYFQFETPAEKALEKV